jgi:NitT/TauT family transport system substrate-binding protein
VSRASLLVRITLVGRWLLALSACTLPGLAHAVPTVTLGVVNWIGYGPLYCAAANGYYRRYGFDVKLVTFSDNSLMSGALQGGELTFSTLTYDQVLVAAARGWKIKVIMPIDYSTGGDAILASNAVQSVRDLKGRRIAFQPVSPSDFLLGYALAQVGLTERDVRSINATPEGVVGVMATGMVDAGVTYQPSVSVILKLGGGKQFHVLLSSREARGMITDIIAVKQSTIEQDPKLVEGLIRGTLEGLAFMHKEPVKAAALIAKTLEITPADVQAQLPNIENPPLAQLTDVFASHEVLPSFYASGQVIGNILMKQGLIQRLPPIADTFDARFVAAVQAHPGDLK